MIVTQWITFVRNFIKRTLNSPLSFIIYFVLPPVGLMGIYYLVKSTPDAAIAEAQGIGFLQYFILLQACLITGLSVKDREEGILVRIRTAPVREIIYTAGCGSASFVLVSLQSAITLAFAIFLFKMTNPESYFPLLGVFILFSFTGSGIGLLIAEISSDTTQSTIISNFTGTLTSLLGGSFFPVEFMSPFMRKLSVIFPQSWGVKAVREILTSENSRIMFPALFVLFLFGVLSLVLNAYIQKRRDLA